MLPVDFLEHFRTVFPHLVTRRVLIALSGGADSVALLHLLRSPELALDLQAAHVHHGVRGDEADGDAEFCAALCADLDVPFHLLKIDPHQPAVLGREATWRRLRYRVLLDLACTTGCQAVATGHHRDDVAEGVLVQLLRGGGPRALAGIVEDTGTVIRPLLGWSGADLVAWLEEQGLTWREDSSNLDPKHLRNLVRHQLLPGLEAASPSLRSHLVHLAEALARDDGYLSSQLEATGSWIDPWEPEGGVPVSAVAGLPPPLRARWLHAQAARIGLTRVTRRQAELFAALIENAEVRAVTLGGRWCLRRAGDSLWLEPPTAPEPYRVHLVENVCVDLPLPGWCIRLATAQEPNPEARWCFDTDHPAGLEVRSPAKTDVVEVNGRPARVSRLLARKLPRHLRSSWPVCCESDRIQWIPGVWRGPEPSSGASHVVEVLRRERPASVI